MEGKNKIKTWSQKRRFSIQGKCVSILKNQLTMSIRATDSSICDTTVCNVTTTWMYAYLGKMAPQYNWSSIKFLGLPIAQPSIQPRSDFQIPIRNLLKTSLRTSPLQRFAARILVTITQQSIILSHASNIRVYVVELPSIASLQTCPVSGLLVSRRKVSASSDAKKGMRAADFAYIWWALWYRDTKYLDPNNGT